MTRLLIAAVMIAATTAAHAGAAGEQSRFYDSRGNSVGSATTDSQGTTTFRDSRGSTTGTATFSPGSGTVFRDSRGNVTGRSSR
jgi:hypothetical protein